MTEATLFAQVRAWIADDPDQATARALTADLASAEAGDKAAQSPTCRCFLWAPPVRHRRAAGSARRWVQTE
jgi:hypothetical protein